MKLIRYGEAGAERPGLLLGDGKRVAAPHFCRDYDEAFFASGGPARLAEWAAGDLSGLETVAADVRWGAPVARPSKIVCAGLNYRAHAVETGAAIPDEPVLFMKASSAWSGPFDEVHLPPGSQKLDWEVELALVIGRGGSNIAKDEALGRVFGYTILNDVSARDLQNRHQQFFYSKSLDGSAPMGPWLVTADEIPDPHALRIQLRLNGATVQDSSTGDMIFDIASCIATFTTGITLESGDIITTGTPSGVGMGMTPQQWLKAGDVMECEIEGIGVLRNVVG